MVTPLLTPENAMVFGALPIQPEEIVRVLREEINRNTASGCCRPTRKNPSQNEDPRKHTRPWTEAVYRTLERRLVAIKGRALFTVSEEAKSEFLLDFVWLDEVNGKDRGALMGMECEWARDRTDACEAVTSDFRKLLYFKAPLKLLVYECRPRDRDCIREMLRDCLKDFEQHARGECYLFVEFYGNCPKSPTESWPQEAWEFRVEQNGVVPIVAFRSIRQGSEVILGA